MFYQMTLNTSLIRALNMTLKFSSNLSFMFQEAPSMPARYQMAKSAGFKAVESGFPFGSDLNQIVEAKRTADIQQVLVNVYTGDTSKGELGFAAIPDKQVEFQKSIETTIQLAKDLDCKKIHVMAGKVESPTKENDKAYENSLRFAVEKFASEDITGLIEPINSTTVPNYFLNDFEKALKVVQKINSPNLKLLLDFFHLQQISGSLTKTVEKLQPYIGHIQIAQVPDRSEPDTIGEIDYRYVFALLEKIGYDGYIGLEYKPRGNSREGLKWFDYFGLKL